MYTAAFRKSNRPAARRLAALVANAFLWSFVVPNGSAGESDNRLTPLGECLAREGAASIIDRESVSRYEAKLFVTPDEVARYVFLTNRWDYGDRSAAIYCVRRKKGSLPGDYWITATVAEDSTRGPHRNRRVQRHDAPLPASVAHAVHALWLAVLQQTPTDEDAIPCAPTGVFSVTSSNGARLTAVTVDLDQDSFCIALMNVGGSLVDYAKSPPSERTQAAAEIEKASAKLLQRVEEAATPTGK